jgi:hypothetical protein
MKHFEVSDDATTHSNVGWFFYADVRARHYKFI